MKRILFIFISFVSFIASANPISPIISLPAGNYIGYGSWLADDGSRGHFSSYTNFSANGWQAVQDRDDQLYLYESVLAIDANGFFTAEMIDDTDPNNPIINQGYGNCGTFQCEMIVALANGTMHKTWLYGLSDDIYCFGAIYYNDGTPNVQWEGHSLLLPTDGSMDEFHEINENLEAETKDIDPITWFEAGNYLGDGAWLDDAGNMGSFNNFTSLEDSGWFNIVFTDSLVRIYHAELYIDDYGFFSADITDLSDPNNPVYYQGSGNCGSWYCQLSVDTDTGAFNKTMLFGPDFIYKFGLKTFNDGSPSIQVEASAELYSSY